MKRLALLSLLTFTISVTYAQQCNLSLGDGSGGFPSSSTLYTGDIVYVTGCTYLTPFSPGKIHILHNDGRNYNTTFGLDPNSDALGVPNTVPPYIAGCGGIFDEIVAFCNNGREGEYDLVLDSDNNGQYNPGTDCYVGNGSSYFFRIINTGPMPPWKQRQSHFQCRHHSGLAHLDGPPICCGRLVLAGGVGGGFRHGLPYRL